MSENKKRSSSFSEITEESENQNFKSDEKNVKAFVISSSMISNLHDSQLIQTVDGSKKFIKIQESPNSRTKKLEDFIIDENIIISDQSLDKSNESIIESMLVSLYFTVNNK